MAFCRTHHVSSVLAAFAALFLGCNLYAQSGSCSGMGTGPLANLNGFVPFPANSPWNTDISQSPVDPNSANFINYIGASAPMHADFGSGLYEGQSIGVPYQVSAAGQSKIPVRRTTYIDESDPGPVPMPINSLIQGYPNPGNGDRHSVVIDAGGCWLYEMYGAYNSSGAWSAAEVAIWDMTTNAQRPYLWTAADAAGMPLFPGLARYDEVAAGAIRHALVFTVSATQQAFTPPASHWASSITDKNAPPMGMRLRLKASFDISSYPADDQVILTALKTYGMFVVDHGAPLFVSGAPSPGWNNSNLSLLSAVKTSDFEVVRMDQVYTPANVPTGPAPSINSFSASASSVKSGTPVTLSWNATGGLYSIVTPRVGPVRGTSIVVTPKSTTTYTIYIANQYGRTEASTTVTVQ